MERKKKCDPVFSDLENREKNIHLQQEAIQIKGLLASFRFLFEDVRPDEKNEFSLRSRDNFEEKFLLSLRFFLHKLEEEQENGRAVYIDQVSEEADSIDACNHLFSLFHNEHSFRNALDDALFYSLACFMEKSEFSSPEDPSGLCLDHAMFFASALADLFAGYARRDFLRLSGKNIPSRLQVFPAEILENSFFRRSSRQAVKMELLSGRSADLYFGRESVFRCRKGKYTPVTLPAIRKKEDFYGYREAKTVIDRHLTAFAGKRHNLPLLISGLPGLGKTQMTISYILSHREFILVLPSPEELEEGLEEMITFLARHREKKFVIFFDDVDVRNVDWYFFRTFVGGSSSLPENLLIIIASNYVFPPNVASRGRTFSFPLFDEIRCQEMIGDLFLSRGMEKISSDLLSVIASDYVEAYGQKEFDELSPRTLARYLEDFLKDQGKRKRLLEFSKGEIITRPDPGLFHEQNVRLIRALYGEEAVEKMRNSIVQG